MEQWRTPGSLICCHLDVLDANVNHVPEARVQQMIVILFSASDSLLDPTGDGEGFGILFSLQEEILLRKQNTAAPKQEIIETLEVHPFICSFTHSTSAYLGPNQELGSGLGAGDAGDEQNRETDVNK